METRWASVYSLSCFLCCLALKSATRFALNRCCTFWTLVTWWPLFRWLQRVLHVHEYFWSVCVCYPFFVLYTYVIHVISTRECTYMYIHMHTKLTPCTHYNVHYVYMYIIVDLLSFSSQIVLLASKPTKFSYSLFRWTIACFLNIKTT